MNLTLTSLPGFQDGGLGDIDAAGFPSTKLQLFEQVASRATDLKHSASATRTAEFFHRVSLGPSDCAQDVSAELSLGDLARLPMVCLYFGVIPRDFPRWTVDIGASDSALGAGQEMSSAEI